MNTNIYEDFQICISVPLTTKTLFSNVSIVDFEQVNVSWVTFWRIFKHITLMLKN